jgi:hypothetical protein
MTHWRLFGIAFALPVLFTSLVLIEVLRNRSGAGEGMELTEREVTLSGDTGENSGMTARVKWAADGESRQRWLSRQQLESLGFDFDESPDTSAARGPLRQLQRRAFIAFELRDRLPGSQLVPIDASVDQDEMLAKYPNRRTHLVTAGLVGLRRDLLPGQPGLVDGYVVSIDPRELHVPTEFAGRLRRSGARAPTFTMTVRVGSRLEPWIVDVR